MYILALCYDHNEQHIIYFNSKKKSQKKAYKCFKKESTDTSWAILAKAVSEFDAK